MNKTSQLLLKKLYATLSVLKKTLIENSRNNLKSEFKNVEKQIEELENEILNILSNETYINASTVSWVVIGEIIVYDSYSIMGNYNPVRDVYSLRQNKIIFRTNNETRFEFFRLNSNYMKNDVIAYLPTSEEIYYEDISKTRYLGQEKLNENVKFIDIYGNNISIENYSGFYDTITIYNSIGISVMFGILNYYLIQDDIYFINGGTNKGIFNLQNNKWIINSTDENFIEIIDKYSVNNLICVKYQELKKINEESRREELLSTLYSIIDINGKTILNFEKDNKKDNFTALLEDITIHKETYDCLKVSFAKEDISIFLDFILIKCIVVEPGKRTIHLRKIKLQLSFGGFYKIDP